MSCIYGNVLFTLINAISSYLYTDRLDVTSSSLFNIIKHVCSSHCLSVVVDSNLTSYKAQMNHLLVLYAIKQHLCYC